MPLGRCLEVERVCLGQVVGSQAVWFEVVRWVCLGLVVGQQAVESVGTAACLDLDGQLVLS